MPFGMEKLEWLGYPMVKQFQDMFIRFDRIHERDRQTDTQAPQDGIGRACIASRGKIHGIVFFLFLIRSDSVVRTILSAEVDRHLLLLHSWLKSVALCDPSTDSAVDARSRSTILLVEHTRCRMQGWVPGQHVRGQGQGQ